MNGLRKSKCEQGDQAVTEQTTSHEIKNLLLKHCLTGGLVACTEFSNGADVFSVNKNHYSTEVEIKTNRADLQKEFRCIKGALDLPPKSFNKYGGAINLDIKVTAFFNLEAKVRKHYKYIVDKTTKTTNYYLFCVTEELEQLCTDFIKKHKLPYGLFVVKLFPKRQNFPQGYILEKVFRPQRLQNNKCPQHIIEKVARRACWEAYNLRLEIKPYRKEKYAKSLNQAI